MMYSTQDPKYGIKDNQLVNIETGKPIPSNEPVFILRAKDVFAPQTLAYYLQFCVTVEHKQAVEQRISEFNKFQRDNPDVVKAPDTTFPFVKINEGK